ncbi:DUF58 domain-containing protein [Rhodopirellula sp. MGV]|uniref:DUF58 domain-containing protein n=1 Tax=Rhodopirellula sp. MGV TaxID=2023130 RepID=UPI000B961EEF|nr:DUF58 domain-containing protein [Rhodopirellula sp. MGV]OYP36828.1 DUF58 domain-containing protein [Rhodopirellula sp. MGV]PNY36465.1 DUF58 domain-containing protein [Rhodopirellula baltica]
MRILDFVKPKELARVARLQMLAREVVEGYCTGRHRSPHKGFSVEFKEHRQYVQGDELKNIDWKVFAKSDRLFIRQYEEETNLRCSILVDQSGSMEYGGTRSVEGLTKREYAVRLSAAIAYFLLGQQDPVGLITFDNEIRNQVPLRSRPSHLRAILTALLSNHDRRETDLGNVFRKVITKLGKRGLVVILSDSMGDIESLSRSLAQMRAARHEVIFFQILDPDEVDFPFTGRVQFKDLELAAPEQMVDARVLGDAYRQRLLQHNDDLKEACRRSRVDLVQVTTDQPFVDVLHEYVAARRRLTR